MMSDADMVEERLQVTPKEVIVHPHLLELSLIWHDQFIEEVWQAEAAFHDRSHIEAVERAAHTYLSNKGESDPLEVTQSLEVWNKHHPEAMIEESEFRETLRWAIRCHDLGNIMGRVNVEEGGGLEPVFFDRYRSTNAEARSRRIAQMLLDRSAFPEDKKTRFLPFVKHLIGETRVVMKDASRPFARFMRTVDQVGNDLFSQNPGRIEGLLAEMLGENPDATCIPYNFVNFARVSLPRLLPDENAQRELLEIWGKSLTPERPGASKDPLGVDEFLRIRESRL